MLVLFGSRGDQPPLLVHDYGTRASGAYINSENVQLHLACSCCRSGGKNCGGSFLTHAANYIVSTEIHSGIFGLVLYRGKIQPEDEKIQLHEGNLEPSQASTLLSYT